MAVAEKLWTRKEAAKYLGVRQQRLNVWKWEKKGPPCIKIGGRVFYRPSDIKAMMKDWLVNPPHPNFVSSKVPSRPHRNKKGDELTQNDFNNVCHFQVFCGRLVEAKQMIEKMTAVAQQSAGAIHAQRVTQWLNQIFEEVSAWKADVKE
jgi:hypothetical protein